MKVISKILAGLGVVVLSVLSFILNVLLKLYTKAAALVYLVLAVVFVIVLVTQQWSGLLVLGILVVATLVVAFGAATVIAMIDVGAGNAENLHVTVH